MCNKANAISRHQQPDLTSQELKARGDLSQNHNIIIKPVHKGGGIIVQDRSDYLQEAGQLLSDVNTYARLKQDPLPQL